jgi:DNA gyrase subunit A
MGVKAIDVADDDQVVGFAVTENERPFVLAVCEHGFGKRTNIEEFRIQNRGGKGIILIDASERNGPVVDIKLVKDGDELMLITDRGQMLRTRVGEIRETGRNAQGVKIMSVEDGERVVGVERLAESDEVVDGGGEPGATSEAPPEGSIPPTSIPPPEGELN